ncbi:hypothetical protein [Neobacillus sp. NPDC093127]|uniref:hypothetical protein n=1 Tax=Neobacillus sp. NPDC093127 TaxID=3364296 RepID=UPI00382C3D08
MAVDEDQMDEDNGDITASLIMIAILFRQALELNDDKWVLNSYNKIIFSLFHLQTKKGMQ